MTALGRMRAFTEVQGCRRHFAPDFCIRKALTNQRPAFVESVLSFAQQRPQWVVFCLPLSDPAPLRAELQFMLSLCVGFPCAVTY